MLFGDYMKHDSAGGILSKRRLGRREALRLMGAAATIPFLRYGGERLARAAALPACVVRPEQTEGPYFVDAKLSRSDIRSDSDGSVKPGVPLRLLFQVSRIDGASCSALGGALVDVWQCDALGVYSGVHDTSAAFDTRQKIFLRGNQLTGASGTAAFTTIYPGWYPGRAVHIHFKIRGASAAGRGYEFTSQLYFDDAVTDAIHREAPYNARGRRDTPNDRDFGFRRGGSQSMPALTKEASGYAARFEIGLRIA
jgi:protocatechuate 3,4-dioxygenase beta subunit